MTYQQNVLLIAQVGEFMPVAVDPVKLAPGDRWIYVRQWIP